MTILLKFYWCANSDNDTFFSCTCANVGVIVVVLIWEKVKKCVRNMYCIILC